MLGSGPPRSGGVLLWEASQKALPAVVEGEPEPSADEILVSLLRDVKRTLEQLKAELAITTYS
jgi:hypothetical protein